MKKNILVITKHENKEKARYLAVKLSEPGTQYDAFVCERLGYLSEIADFTKVMDQVYKNKISGVVIDNYDYKNMFTMEILNMLSTMPLQLGDNPPVEITANVPIVITPFDDMGKDTVSFAKEELDKCLI